MKKKNWCAIIFVLFFNYFLMAQHTKRYRDLMSDLRLVDSTLINKNYKNGNKKILGKYYVYLINEYEYQLPVGKHVEYYSNGQKMSEKLYDNLGIPLEARLYGGLNNLLYEVKAIKIDAKGKKVGDVIESLESFEIITEEKKYRFSDKICGWFLFKEGRRRNGKKIGEWKKYYPDGAIKKIKVY